MVEKVTLDGREFPFVPHQRVYIIHPTDPQRPFSPGSVSGPYSIRAIRVGSMHGWEKYEIKDAATGEPRHYPPQLLAATLEEAIQRVWGDDTERVVPDMPTPPPPPKAEPGLRLSGMATSFTQAREIVDIVEDNIRTGGRIVQAIKRYT